MSKIWAYIVAVFGSLLGVLFILFEQKEKLQTKLDASKYSNQDNDLENKQVDLTKKIATDEKAISSEKEPTSVPNLSPEQAADYWNNKK